MKYVCERLLCVVYTQYTIKISWDCWRQHSNDSTRSSSPATTRVTEKFAHDSATSKSAKEKCDWNVRTRICVVCVCVMAKNMYRVKLKSVEHETHSGYVRAIDTNMLHPVCIWIYKLTVCIRRYVVRTFELVLLGSFLLLCFPLFTEYIFFVITYFIICFLSAFLSLFLSLSPSIHLLLFIFFYFCFPQIWYFFRS